MHIVTNELTKTGYFLSYLQHRGKKDVEKCALTYLWAFFYFATELNLKLFFLLHTNNICEPSFARLKCCSSSSMCPDF